MSKFINNLSFVPKLAVVAVSATIRTMSTGSGSLRERMLEADTAIISAAASDSRSLKSSFKASATTAELTDLTGRAYDSIAELFDDEDDAPVSTPRARRFSGVPKKSVGN